LSEIKILHPPNISSSTAMLTVVFWKQTWAEVQLERNFASKL